MFDNLSGNEKAVALLLGFVLFAGLIENAPALIFLLILFGVLYMSRRDDSSSSDRVEVRRPGAAATSRQVQPQRQRETGERVQAHALEAVRRAGLDPSKLPVLPVDLGLISFHGDEDPVVHRNWPVDDDSDYIQPFVQLRVPQAAAGRVRFEITDHTGQTVFIHEDNYELKRGRNFVMPAARLPVHDAQEIGGTWQMRVIADGIPLVDYRFTWASPEEQEPGIERHIGEDGELNSEMRAVIAHSRLQRMSLDDLLGNQDADDGPIFDEDAQQRARR